MSPDSSELLSDPGAAVWLRDGTVEERVVEERVVEGRVVEGRVVVLASAGSTN